MCIEIHKLCNSLFGQLMFVNEFIYYSLLQIVLFYVLVDRNYLLYYMGLVSYPYLNLPLLIFASKIGSGNLLIKGYV